MFIKKILNYIFVLILLVVIFTLFEMTSFSTKYINRAQVTFEINNTKNPQVKKMLRFMDNVYSLALLKLSKKHKSYLNQQDLKYVEMPEEKIISGKKKNFTINMPENNFETDNWHRSHGDNTSSRFSNLKKINLKNVHKLELAWIYEFDEIKNDIQANPIIAEKKIYIPSTSKKIVSIDAVSGQKIWEYKTEGTPARRGLVYLKESKISKSRIYFCAEKELISINPNNGNLIKSFGKNGKVKLKNRCKVSPAIIKDKLIIATVEPAIEVYDLLEGELLWKFYLKDKKNNEKRNGGKRYDFSGGNPWGGISADSKRGVIFVTTGNAGFYFNGVNRPGNNKYSNSVVAIDIFKKKKLWDFQEVSHDIWNFDISAPPILTSITKDNIKIDVVVAVTKLGNTLVLDRLTGEPIFDFHKKKAPLSKIPGEKTSYYQPNLKIPEPFAKQFFDRNEITNISNESSTYIKDKLKNSNFGFFKPHEINKKNILFNFHGGAQWMGASVDSKKSIMYVTSHNIPWTTKIKKIKKKLTYYKYDNLHKRLLDQDGYPGSKPPWGTLTAMNLNKGKIIWQVPFGEYQKLSLKGIPITGTENYGGATATAGNIIFATGTVDKKIRAFDSTNGKEVWSYQLEFAGSGPPSIYSINGEQYVIVASTGSLSLSSGYPEVNFGNLLYSFKIKE